MLRIAHLKMCFYRADIIRVLLSLFNMSIMYIILFSFIKNYFLTRETNHISYIFLKHLNEIYIRIVPIIVNDVNEIQKIVVFWICHSVTYFHLNVVFNLETLIFVNQLKIFSCLSLWHLIYTFSFKIHVLLILVLTH